MASVVQLIKHWIQKPVKLSFLWRVHRLKLLENMFVCLSVRFVYKIFYIRSALLSNDRKCARADLSPVSIRNHAFVPHSYTHGIKAARTSRFLQNRFFQVHTSSLWISLFLHSCLRTKLHTYIPLVLVTKTKGTLTTSYLCFESLFATGCQQWRL